MVRRVAVLASLMALAGCGEEEKRVPADCLAGEPAILGALKAAPREVRLTAGTPLSDCVRLGTSQAESQNVGIVLLRVADRLLAEVDASDAAAAQLGYLVGATERGAARTNGVQVELARRMAQVVGIGGPRAERRAAYAEGRRAGKMGG